MNRDGSMYCGRGLTVSGGGTKITCKSGGPWRACEDVIITGFNEVVCEGEGACAGSLLANNQKLTCSGNDACAKAEIRGEDGYQLTCAGENACRAASISDCQGSYPNTNEKYYSLDSRSCETKKALDAGCGRDAECASGFCNAFQSACKLRPCSSGTCPSHHYCKTDESLPFCTDKKAWGEDCALDEECNSGNCEKGADNYSECGNPPETSCFDSSDCPGHQYCDTTSAKSYCVEKKDGQEECDFNVECKSGNCEKGADYFSECGNPW